MVGECLRDKGRGRIEDKSKLSFHLRGSEKQVAAGGENVPKRVYFIVSKIEIEFKHHEVHRS